MALGFVSGGNAFKWFGDRVSNWVGQQIDQRLYRAGAAIVARAQQLAPVKTGALRASIDYVVGESPGLSDHYLSIQVGVPYGIFQEFGTRNIPPHPYIRPAINEVGRIFGAEISMDFMAPGVGPWQGIYYAHQRRPQYVVPSAIQPKPLTAKQRRHVERYLVPSARALHRGNVKRAKMRVRHIG